MTSEAFDAVTVVAIAAFSGFAIFVAIFLAGYARSKLVKGFVPEDFNAIRAMVQTLVLSLTHVGTDLGCFLVNIAACDNLALVLKLTLGCGLVVSFVENGILFYFLGRSVTRGRGKKKRKK